jgi:hypothetical protein
MTLMLRLREMSVENITPPREWCKDHCGNDSSEETWDRDSRQHVTYSYIQSLRKCSERTEGTTHKVVHFTQKQPTVPDYEGARRTPLLRPYQPPHSSMICSVYKSNRESLMK